MCEPVTSPCKLDGWMDGWMDGWVHVCVRACVQVGLHEDGVATLDGLSRLAGAMSRALQAGEPGELTSDAHPALAALSGLVRHAGASAAHARQSAGD
eukprot:3800-Chlamydomonas_euryale.AAC.1